MHHQKFHKIHLKSASLNFLKTLCSKKGDLLDERLTWFKKTFLNALGLTVRDYDDIIIIK